MTFSSVNQNEIFASDLLSTQANALTLNGLSADYFFRRDVTSFPFIDGEIDLGLTNKKINDIFLYKINSERFELFMRENRSNTPTINSDGSTGFDFGSISNYWRTIYSRTIIADLIKCPSILQPNGSKFSHKDLSDIGISTHIDIDNHINATADVHGAISSNIGNRIVTRDPSGNIWVSIMYGTATRAQYADLAEKYTCENMNMDFGTVYKISSNKNFDVEVCNDELSLKIVGILSKNPAFLMNDKSNGIALGLKGRLNARIIGKVKKGDILVSTYNGCLRRAENDFEECFKIALANDSSDIQEEKVLECIL